MGYWQSWREDKLFFPFLSTAFQNDGGLNIEKGKHIAGAASSKSSTLRRSCCGSAVKILSGYSPTADERSVRIRIRVVPEIPFVALVSCCFPGRRNEFGAPGVQQIFNCCDTARHRKIPDPRCDWHP